MKKRAPYIPRKGKSKREMWLELEALRKQGYDIPQPKPKLKTQQSKAITQPIPPMLKHEGHKWILERGNWGPHTARYICMQCEGAFVKWASTKRRHHV